MQIELLIENFFKYVKEDNIEIYNEFSLQFELAFYLKKELPKGIKIQLERNITFLNLKKKDYLKKEIDLLIFDKEKKEIIVIEIKCLVKQRIARPITVYNWIKDIRFLEQLVENNNNINCFSIFVTDNSGFFNGQNNNVGKLLTDFRNCKIKGEYSNHSKDVDKRNVLKIESEYILKWNNISDKLFYFTQKID